MDSALQGAGPTAPLPAAPTRETWTLLGYTWDLQFTASGLRAIQMRHGALFAFSQQLLAENMGNGMPFDTQALLIWAAQLKADPRLKLGQVKSWLGGKLAPARLLLVSWAAAEFCRVVMEMATAEIAAANPTEEAFEP